MENPNLQTVPVTINPGKETKEIIDAAISVITTAIGPDKKNIGAYVAKLGEVTQAATGSDLVDDENKVAEIRNDNAAYAIKKLMDAFVK